MNETIMGFIELYGPKIVGALIVLIAGLILKKIVTKLTLRILAKGRLDQTLHGFIKAATSILMWIFILLTVAGTLGIPMATFITALGAAGAAIALALKDSLSSVAAGILIILNKPFAIGDFIEVGANKGNVVSIGLTYTQINTTDNKVVFVPNSQITSEAIINYTREPIRRVDRIFSISYEDDFERAKQIILNIANAYPAVLKQPAEPVAMIINHNSSSIDIVCRAWVPTDEYFNFDFYMLETVKKEFDAAGISIPYPQLDLHVIQGIAK